MSAVSPAPCKRSFCLRAMARAKRPGPSSAGDAAIAYPDPADWREIAREDHPADDAGRPAYSFVTFTRKTG